MPLGHTFPSYSEVYSCNAVRSPRMRVRLTVDLAVRWAFPTEGSRMEISRAMIETTTKSSMRVKPCLAMR